MTQQRHEHCTGILRGSDGIEKGFDFLEVAFDQRGNDGGLGREVAVEIADAHLRRLRQILHRGALEAIESEHRLDLVENIRRAIAEGGGHGIGCGGVHQTVLGYPCT